jgi:hypothetical protein
MANPNSSLTARRNGPRRKIVRGTFRSAATVILDTHNLRGRLGKSKGRKLSSQDKIFMTTLFLAAFSLGILTLTGAHLLLSQ